ncbi:MAG: winged helix-turn-helix domain-containing protein [Dysgonomonas sp.]
MLKAMIGEDAGLIWQLLSERGSLSIDELEKLTEYRRDYIYLSLGWLSREGKINYFEKNDDLYIELNHSYHEAYY